MQSGPRPTSTLVDPPSNPTTSFLPIVFRLSPSTSRTPLPTITSSSDSRAPSSPSVTLSTFIFVAIGLGTVLLAGWSRWLWARKERRLRSSRPVHSRRDVAVGLAGGDGWGRARDASKGGGEGVLIRPRIVEVELTEAKETLKMEGLQPLSLSIKPIFPRRHPPQLYLSVIVVPPSATPIRPRQRYLNSNQVDEREELPEIEIGSFVVDLALKSDFRSRAGWESYKKRLREEEVAWGKKLLEEEEEER